MPAEGERPAGDRDPYPYHWEADVVLSDGGTAHLRPIRSGDADLLRAFHSRLSAESIYYRFFSPRPRLTEREIAHFTTVDHDDRVALIATIGTDLIAVVRYDRLDVAGEKAFAGPGAAGGNEAPPAGETAEVAFLVEDAHQGRGLGTVLLEHAAAAARERGVRRFVADVLPDNRRMTKVFREAGYQAEQRFEDGIIRLTLDLEPTETSVEVMTAREHRAESRSIQRLLHPRSVAVIGAGREPRSVGRTVLNHLLEGDFSGPVYPVHPTANAVAGVRAYASVLDIPDEVDLAVVAVPTESVHEVVQQSAGKGVHGLIVVSAGFGETGQEGRDRQHELVRLARAHGMRVVGPNCLGIANTAADVRLNATLAPTMPGHGPVGFFSQSGALGIAILQRTAERGLGLSTFVSAGNRADVSGNDLLQYWEEDPATGAVLLYLESIGNPRKFTRLARRLGRKKPVVVVKAGRSTQGVPLGHAARALTLPDHAVSALFAQAGLIRVDDLSELFDVAQLLAYQPLPAGRRVAVIHNSDALGRLAQDAAVALDLDPRSPVDLGPQAGPADYEAALSNALGDSSVDSVVVLFTPPVVGSVRPAAHGAWSALRESADPGDGSGAPGTVAEAVVRLAEGSAKPIVATYLGAKGMPPELRIKGPGGEARAGSVPSYPAPEDAVRALAYATRYAAWRRRPLGRPAESAGAGRDLARGLVDAILDGGEGPVEATSEQAAELLACYGIEVGTGSSGGEPPGAERRSDPGPGGHVPGDPVRSGPADRPVAIRIRAREDPSFGAVVSFGLSGVAAVLLDDRAYRLAPLTDIEAADMIRAVRTAPLLFGHQGAEPVDTRALETLVLRVSRLADDLPEVELLELDPVLARRSGLRIEGVSLRLRQPAGARSELGPRRLPAF